MSKQYGGKEQGAAGADLNGLVHQASTGIRRGFGRVEMKCDILGRRWGLLKLLHSRWIDSLSGRLALKTSAHLPAVCPTVLDDTGHGVPSLGLEMLSLLLAELLAVSRTGSSCSVS